MLTRKQALEWNENWSYTDREIIKEHFDRLDPQRFYVIPSGGYVGCVDASGRLAMRLHAGYLESRRELAPADLPNLDWPGLTLSTFAPHASPTVSDTGNEAVCPIHHVTLPRSGVCDDCK